MFSVDLAPLREDVASIRQRVHAWKGQAELLLTQQKNHQQKKDELEAKVELKKKVQKVLQQLEETWRGAYEEALGALGGRGLNAVFTSGKYEVLLESNIKRGASSLDIVLVKDGNRVRLKGGSGGSVVQVLAYLLRHLMTTAQKPALRRLAVLDEPFSMLRPEQRPALSMLVEDITNRLDFQFLFSSDEDELADVADVVYQVYPGGKVELIKKGQEVQA